MDKKTKDKIMAHAGRIFYGVYTEDFETNILRYIIDNPKITAKELSQTKISTWRNGRSRKMVKINAECVAQKFIDIVIKLKKFK